MPYFILFLKGFIIGIGKIIPGVSGCALAVVMGIYEEALSRLANLNKNIKENFKYLFPLALGILMAILVFSKVILFFLEHFNLVTMCLFFGLLLGIIPSLKNKVKFKFKDFIIMLIIIVAFLLLFNNLALPFFIINSKISYLWVIFLGMIDALSMIVPGLSGTAFYLMLGSYSFVLNLFSNPFQDILASFCFCLGFGISFVIFTKLFNYLLKKYNHQTWVIIFSFILFSLLEFFLQIPFSFSNIFSGFCFIFLGFILALLTPS